MIAKLRIAGPDAAAPAKPVRTPEVRWTQRLIKKGGGFTPVSVYFLRNYYRLLPELTSAEVVVLIHLFSYKWDASMPFPGSNALAERMGISATAVRGHLRSLHKSKKCLIRHVRTGTTNKYDLSPLFRKLEALMDADEVAAAKKNLKAAVA